MLRRTAHYQLKSSWMGQADLKMACHLLCSTHGNCDDLVPACAYEYRPYFWPGRSSLQWIFGEVSEYFPGAHFPWQFSDSGQLFLQSIGKHSLATALILFRKIHCLGSRAADFGRAVRIDGLPCAGVLSSLLIGILFIVFLVYEWRALAEWHSISAETVCCTNWCASHYLRKVENGAYSPYMPCLDQRRKSYNYLFSYRSQEKNLWILPKIAHKSILSIRNDEHKHKSKRVCALTAHTLLRLSLLMDLRVI